MYVQHIFTLGKQARLHVWSLHAHKHTNYDLGIEISTIVIRIESHNWFYILLLRLKKNLNTSTHIYWLEPVFAVLLNVLFFPESCQIICTHAHIQTPITKFTELLRNFRIESRRQENSATFHFSLKAIEYSNCPIANYSTELNQKFVLHSNNKWLIFKNRNHNSNNNRGYTEVT